MKKRESKQRYQINISIGLGKDSAIVSLTKGNKTITLDKEDFTIKNGAVTLNHSLSSYFRKKEKKIGVYCDIGDNKRLAKIIETESRIFDKLWKKQAMKVSGVRNRQFYHAHSKKQLWKRFLKMMKNFERVETKLKEERKHPMIMLVNPIDFSNPKNFRPRYLYKGIIRDNNEG